MLPAAHRLTDAASFREATRRGRRASSARLVTYLLTAPAVAEVSSASVERAAGVPVRVGFVVGKTVGNSVVRNRVQRRLRHAALEHLAALPGAGVLVVRALPSAADSSYAELSGDLARCLSRCGAAA